jgi:hypothetical protein
VGTAVAVGTRVVVESGVGESGGRAVEDWGVGEMLVSPPQETKRPLIRSLMLYQINQEIYGYP